MSAKLDASGGTATNLTISGATASRTLVTDGSGNVTSSSISSAALGTLAGIDTGTTVQGQIDDKPESYTLLSDVDASGQSTNMFYMVVDSGGSQIQVPVPVSAVSTKAYGAAEDGVTDDTAAIQLAANHGGPIMLGNSRITSSIVLTNSNTHFIQRPGTSLTCSVDHGTVQNFQYRTKGVFEIGELSKTNYLENISFTGIHATNDDADTYLVLFQQATDGSTEQMTRVRNFTMRDCVTTDLRLIAGNGDNPVISNNRATNTLGKDATLDPDRQVAIIWMNFKIPPGDAGGTGGDVQYSRSKGVISGNIIRKFESGIYILSYFDIHKIDEIVQEEYVITGNLIEGTSQAEVSGGAITEAGRAGIYCGSVDRVVISGNVIKYMYDVGIDTEMVPHAIVSDNDLEDCRLISFWPGYSLKWHGNTVVINDRAESLGGEVARVTTGPLEVFDVSGNTFINRDSSDTAMAEFAILGSVNSLRFVNNNLIDCVLQADDSNWFIRRAEILDNSFELTRDAAGYADATTNIPLQLWSDGYSRIHGNVIFARGDLSGWSQPAIRWIGDKYSPPSDSSHTGDGMEDTFEFSFAGYREDWMVITVNGTPTTDFTITDWDDENNTTVTFGTAPGSGHAIVARFQPFGVDSTVKVFEGEISHNKILGFDESIQIDADDTFRQFVVRVHDNIYDGTLDNNLAPDSDEHAVWIAGNRSPYDNYEQLTAADPATPPSANYWARGSTIPLNLATGLRYVCIAEGAPGTWIQESVESAFGDDTELTIATGAITVTSRQHNVDTEANAASDDLDTINGNVQDGIVTLRANTNGRAVIVKDATGNIRLNGDFRMDHTQDSITLVKVGSSWLEVSRSDNDQGLVTFTDADATPSVAGHDKFRTANTGPTTITTFDDRSKGQLLLVIFDDSNTTIDFTGTTLKGNAGVDWSPSSGDFMTAFWDGSNWYCEVHDTTP